MKRLFLTWIVLVPALLAAGCGSKVTNPGGGGGGGNNIFGWNRQVPPTSNDLLSVSFADSLHGWAVGVFVIVHTSDGGKTWVDQTQNAMRTTVQFNGVAAADSLHAWVVGADGSIQATSNGGQSWLLETITAGTIYNGVCVTDTLSGWACGRQSGLAYAAYTNNGGHLWLPATTTGLHEMRAISFPKGSPFTGLTAGTLGEIALSQDGGRSFSRVQTPTTQQLQAIAMAPGAGGQFAVAGGVPGIGSALVTSNGGADWITTQTLIGGMEVLGATMAGPNAAWLVGHQQGHAVAMGSLDGGRSWLTQPVNWGLPLNGISFPDPLHGWSVGDGGAIFYTVTGGQ